MALLLQLNFAACLLWLLSLVLVYCGCVCCMFTLAAVSCSCLLWLHLDSPSPRPQAIHKKFCAHAAVHSSLGVFLGHSLCCIADTVSSAIYTILGICFCTYFEHFIIPTNIAFNFLFSAFSCACEGSWTKNLTPPSSKRRKGGQRQRLQQEAAETAGALAEFLECAWAWGECKSLPRRLCQT